MKSSGEYSLIGCTVAPAFEFKDLELAPKNGNLLNLILIFSISCLKEKK